MIALTFTNWADQVEFEEQLENERMRDTFEHLLYQMCMFRVHDKAWIDVLVRAFEAGYMPHTRVLVASASCVRDIRMSLFGAAIARYNARV